MPRTKGAKDTKPRKPRGSDSPRILPANGGPPPAGHNSGDLTEEQKQALFLQHVSMIEPLKKKLASINSDLRNAYKKAKADGYPKTDFDYAAELRSKDEKVMIEQRKREQLIAKWLAHPIGTQPDMFDGVDRTPIKERAYDEGKVAGMAGEGCAPPDKYSPESEAGQAWIAGWHDGMTAGRSLFKEKEPATPTAPDVPEPFDDLPEEGNGTGATAH